MKKGIQILLCIALCLLAGCEKKSDVPQIQRPVTTFPPETTAAAPTETEAPTVPTTVPLPQTEEATILAGKVPAVLAILSRGDTVALVGEYDEAHYVIQTELGFGLVAKPLLDTGDQDSYEPWTGYSRWNRNVYSSYQLSGAPIAVLTTNQKVEVLDEFEGCYLVQYAEGTGFMKTEDLSKYPISSSGGDSDSSGGGSGGGGSQDGGDISLRIRGGITLLSAIEQEGVVTGQATVRADGTEVVLGYFNREDTCQVVTEPGFCEDWEGYTSILMDGLYAHVPNALLRRQDDAPYEEWDGYAKYQTKFYGNYHLEGDGTQVSTNTKLHVAADLGVCYLITSYDGIAYVAKDKVSLTPIATQRSSEDSGGGGGGGQEWSDPVL